MQSQNGWTVHTSASGLKSLDWVTGRVVPGDVHTVFDYLCRRFHAEVEPIRRDWSWGYAFRPIRGKSSGYSNHASGTAIDLNAPAHPLGKRGTFTGEQATAIRRIVDDLDGAIRWGGNYSGRPDEMHFEVNTSAAALAAVVRKITEKKDWFDMATKKELEDVVRKQLEETVPVLMRKEIDRVVGDVVTVPDNIGTAEYRKKNPTWKLSRAVGEILKRSGK